MHTDINIMDKIDLQQNSEVTVINGIKIGKAIKAVLGSKCTSNTKAIRATHIAKSRFDRIIHGKSSPKVEDIVAIAVLAEMDVVIQFKTRNKE